MKYFLMLMILCASGLTGAQDTARVSLLFAGDIMGHDSQIASAYDPVTGTYDYSPCFEFAGPYIEDADVAIGNLELTLAGPPYKGYPQFSSPSALAATLKSTGFDVLVTANNHSVDRGKRGVERTIHVLDSLDILHTGTFSDEVTRLNDYPLILNKNGFRIALLNYTYGTNGIPVPEPTIVNRIDTALIRRDFINAKHSQPDITIAFLHWGNEYEKLPAGNQERITDFCFGLGIDLVIGSHPHVLQPMEWRKESGKVVVYSLGNFVSGQRKQYTDGGATAYVELKKVRYRPDSVVTSIDSVGYYLHWVYRTSDDNKDYYILPVSFIESDPARIIRDKSSLQAFNQFVADSRELFGTYNLNFNEVKKVPGDTLVRYKIHLKVPEVASDSSHFTMDEVDDFFGIEQVHNDNGGKTVLVGNFRSRSQAERLCARFRADGEDAIVVRYLNNTVDGGP